MHAARRSILLATVIAGVWIVVALVRTETTMHLGPLLVPLIPALVAWRAPGLLGATLAASALAAAVLWLLATSGNLEGPAFAPFPDALSEGVAFLAGAMAAGIGLSFLARREPT